MKELSWVYVEGTSWTWIWKNIAVLSLIWDELRLFMLVVMMMMINPLHKSAIFQTKVM